MILSASQAADSVILQVRVPLVRLARFMVFASGSTPPAVPEKLRPVGFRSMLGVVVVPPLETMKLTATDAVWLRSFLPAMAIRTVLLYVPAERPLWFTFTDIVSFSVEMVPDAGDTLSQGEVSVTVQFLSTSAFFENVTV